MFLAVVGGPVTRAPLLTGIWNDTGHVEAQCLIYGKQGITYTVALEQETSIGSGSFTQVGTASVSIVSGDSRSFSGSDPYLDFASVTYPAAGYKFRLRIISPVQSPYSNEVANT